MPSHIPIRLTDAAVSYGRHTLWEHLNLEVQAGELLAILGPNGAGKTTLLRVLLGQKKLTHGTCEIGGRPVRRGSRLIGYVPQQKAIEAQANIRGWDLVSFGLDGDKWGIRLPNRKKKQRVDSIIEQLGASSYAYRPLRSLSGGEQQRLRIAQALITEPEVLLCDEPLLSLDISHQQMILELIDQVRKDFNLAILMVSHEINPILPLLDRVVYIASGQACVGDVDTVMQGEFLSRLYGSEVHVWRHDGQILVSSQSEIHAPVPLTLRGNDDD